MSRETFKVPMKRGGEMPMSVEYTAEFENEPTGQGWVIYLEGFYFNDRDRTDRSELVDVSREEELRERIADSVESSALDNGWRRPRPYPQYYYR